MRVLDLGAQLLRPVAADISLVYACHTYKSVTCTASSRARVVQQHGTNLSVVADDC